MSKQLSYTIVVLLKYTKEWLALDRNERNAFNDRYVNPIFAKYYQTVKVRFFDAEAFHATHSDFALFEVTDLKDYYFMMEELRDSALFSKGYMVINDVIMGLEGGYEMFEEETGI